MFPLGVSSLKNTPEPRNSTLFTYCHSAAQLLFPQLHFPFAIPHHDIIHSSPLSIGKLQMASSVIKTPHLLFQISISSLSSTSASYINPSSCQSNLYALLYPQNIIYSPLLYALSSAWNAVTFSPMKIQLIYQDQLQF